MQLLSDFQDVYLQHKYDFDVVETPVPFPLKLDVELKKATHHKNSSTF